jgi:hypothetical protein
VATTVGIGFVLLILGAVFLFIARWLLRLALKLALVMTVFFVLAAGAGIGWWQGWFGKKNTSQVPTRQTTRRPNSNARPVR